MTKFYTGVGSRKTPPPILEVMYQLAQRMSKEGWTLRSGGAEGADQAFEAGAGPQEIYRPQGDYRARIKDINEYPADLWQRAMDLAAETHPAWHKCSAYAMSLHARNAFQVLGFDLQTPSSGVFCWTPDGAQTEAECSFRTGGTGTAIRIADRYGVPVRNLQRPDVLQAALQYIQG